MTPGSSKTARIALRKAWLVVLTVILGAMAAFAVASRQQTVYTARAVLVVPPFDASDDDGIDDDVAANDPLGRPFDANLLAFTYSSLLTEDATVLDTVAAASGLTFREVSNKLTVTNTQNTPLIVVVAEDGEQGGATSLLTAFLDAVTGSEPASPSIAPDSLRTVRIEAPEESSPPPASLATFAGMILGGAVGVVVAAFWERSHPRIDTAEDASVLLGLPARHTAELVDDLGLWVLHRWSELAGGSRTVVIVDCGPIEASTILDVVRRMAGDREVKVFYDDTGPQGVRAVEITNPPGGGTSAASSSPKPAIGGRLRVEVTRPPKGRVGFRGPESEGGLVVLAIAGGTEARSVAEIVDVLTSIGVSPRWAVVHG